MRSAGIAEDITDRKRRELEHAELLVRERAARAAAEAVVRAKDEFLGVVSHELRSPLNAIRGWAHILRRDAIDGAVLERAVDAILRNADAQARVIDDLMDSARIIQGKMSVELRPGSLNAIINAAADAQRPMIEAKRLRFALDLDPGIGLVVMDPERIQQVLFNLLSNAIKFTSEGGRVCLQSRVDETAVVIRVIDDGVGIARPMLPYVFDRFWQGDASRTRRHGGIGLGLAISRQLVELHGGSIAAASDGVGRGATLTVRLPRQEFSVLEQPP